MLFDTHAHMDDRAFCEDRAQLLASLKDAGVGLLMNPGCSLGSSRNAVKLAERYDWIYAAVGSHPDVADEVTEEVLEEYRKLSKYGKVKAIGEIGIDYHYEDIPRELQKKAFFTVYPLPVRLSTMHTPAFFRIEFLSKEGWTWLSNSRFPTG